MNTITDRINFIRKAFGSCSIDRTGKNAAVRCPSCDSDKEKKKLSINLDTWQAHCWVCGLKGKTVFPILKKFCDAKYADIFSEHFTEYKLNTDHTVSTANEKLSLPESFLFLGNPNNARDPDVRSCLRYLKKREVNEKDVWYFKLGTASNGRHRRRVIIPSFDTSGNLNFFVGRSIDSDGKYKYINADVNKKLIIFNEHNIDWSEELTLVEGPFDLMKCNENATCLLGSSLTEGMLLFERIITNRTPVLIAMDSDMRSKAQKIAMKLASFDCEVRILNLSEKRDVGEMSKEEFKKASVAAEHWSRSQSLKYKISEINSGSNT